ncbi:MAG: hypothetical protein GF355_09300 [Candidatus Eisenbacteria bacterium]|nr:hypothetical protein [Candidatus Eisenbacteria bacterium]
MRSKPLVGAALGVGFRERRGDATVAAVGVLAAWVLAATSVAAFEIGHTELTFVDPERGNRQIPTEVYYPADVAGEDVPVAEPPPDGFPVGAFGHGFVISVDDYDFVWEGLAPAGYIVALPRTETGIFPDHLDLGLDLAFVCSALQAAGDNPQSIFYGTVAAASAVGGHSMGGGASFLALASDPGITALFNFAAAETSPSAIGAAAEITTPALLFAGSLDCVTPPADHQLPMYEALASDCRTYVELLGASHCQFAEYNSLCEFGESGCDPPEIDRDEQHAVTLAFLVPWLDHFLKNDPQGWFDFQELLASHQGIVYLQDCEVSGTAELSGVAGGPRLTMYGRNVGGERFDFAVDLPAADFVQLSIYDAAGRRVRVIVERILSPGRHALAWDGTGSAGRSVAAGCYFGRLDSHPACEPVRVMLIR